MAIEHIHTYLVYPNKGADEPRATGGAEVELTGKVFSLLQDIYGNTDRDCTIDISFNPQADGAADNPCRALLLAYVGEPNVANGRALAERLGANTTKRSALGLMFIALGTENGQRKIVIARFPANSGILAEENQRSLNVEFLERVFMRSANSYKAAVYQDVFTTAGFWMGRAVDRQINSREVEVSQYWIADFLDSDFRTTSAAGTRRLAVAMRDVARKTADLSVKKEIAAAVTLAAGLNGQTLTATEFSNRFGLSDDAVMCIKAEMKHASLADEQFRFDAQEFAKQVPYRSIELDSGAILTADAANFDKIFSQEPVEGDGDVRFSAVGKVVSEKLEKSR